jgi:hypothetical protein
MRYADNLYYNYDETKYTTHHSKGIIITLIVLAILTLGLVIGSYTYTAITKNNLLSRVPKYKDVNTIVQQITAGNDLVIDVDNSTGNATLSWTLPAVAVPSILLSVSLYNEPQNTRLGSFPFVNEAARIHMQIPLSLNIIYIDPVTRKYTISPDWYATIVYKQTAATPLPTNIR